MTKDELMQRGNDVKLAAQGLLDALGIKAKPGHIVRIADDWLSMIIELAKTHYTITATCGNCGTKQTLKVPIGTTVKRFLTSTCAVCKVCNCSVSWLWCNVSHTWVTYHLDTKPGNDASEKQAK